MLAAVKGYYDGAQVKTLEKLNAKKNQKVIVTILDEYLEENKGTAVNSARGILAEYADPALREQEEGAWERAVSDDYDPA